MSGDYSENSPQPAITRRTALATAAALAGAPPAQAAAANPVEPAMNAPLSPVAIPPQVPANEAIAVLPGTRLSYWDTGGNGEIIMLLHPATGSARIWPYQQPVLARAGYRVIAYSRRGYGLSDAVPTQNPGTAAGDLHNLVNLLRLDRFHLLGSAAGGGVAVDYALSHPERLLSLTIACAVGGVTDKDYADAIARIRPKGFDEMPATFRELSPSYRAADPDGTARWSALEQSAVTGNRFGQVPENSIDWAKLATLKVPVLLMGGDADLYLPPPLLRLYASHIAGAETLIVPEGGHSLYWERPDIFNRALLSFLSRHRK